MTKIYQELVEKLTEQKKPKKRFFNFIDSCISIFIIASLVVGFWKGIWCQINYYHKELGIFPVWISFIIAVTINTSIYYSRDALYSFINGGNDNKAKSFFKTVRRILIYRIYHYIFAISSIMIWRCIWEIQPILFSGESFGCLEFMMCKYLHTNNFSSFLWAFFTHSPLHFIIP